MNNVNFPKESAIESKIYSCTFFMKINTDELFPVPELSQLEFNDRCARKLSFSWW